MFAENRQLPPETWLDIFKYLPSEQLNALASTCSDFNQLTSDDSYLWQLKFQDAFGVVDKPSHLTWRAFYTNYVVTWAFGENTCGRLGQGDTALAKLDYNKTVIDQVFESVVIADHCVAYIDRRRRVWLAGMMPNRTFTNTPVLYIDTAVKQVVFNHNEILYVNMDDQLCTQNGRILAHGVAYASNKFCITHHGSVRAYTFKRDVLNSHAINAPCPMKRVHSEYFQDVHGRLWRYSIGHWSTVLIEGHHAPVSEFTSDKCRIAVLDQQKHLWVGISRLEKISMQQFEQVGTGADHTVAVDSEGQVWCIGQNNNYGQLGPNKPGEMCRIPGINANFIAARDNCTIIIGNTY
jgi:hypothetical protein